MSINQLIILVFLLVFVGRHAAADGQDGVVTAPPGEIKCECSPCGNPCGNQTPPPPSPVPPPPPPPPPPVLPPLYPPTPQLPSTPYCPPPPVSPTPPWVPPTPPYSILGPPGDLYPVDPQYKPSSGRQKLVHWLLVFVGYGMVAMWL